MDSVDCFGCDIYCTLETKRHICSPEIVVDRLRKRNHIQTFFSQQIRSLMCSITSKDYQTIQIQLMVSMFHCFDLIYPVWSWYAHQFKWLSGSSENRSTHRKDSRKIFCCQHLKI